SPLPVAMPPRPSAQISSRKQPQQARSAELVEAILDAAVQVLAKEGAQRFTTARVAEKAGVSVGSLYQYFPNKAAILFRLKSDEWRRTCAQRIRSHGCRALARAASRRPGHRHPRPGALGHARNGLARPRARHAHAA